MGSVFLLWVSNDLGAWQFGIGIPQEHQLSFLCQAIAYHDRCANSLANRVEDIAQGTER